VINEDLLPLIRAFSVGEPAEPVLSGARVGVVSKEVGYLNVRPTPSTEDPPIARVDDGALLEALEPEANVRTKVGRQGAWLYIRTPEGVEGYVAAWYLSLYEKDEKDEEKWSNQASRWRWRARTWVTLTSARAHLPRVHRSRG
jgi:hypothetical protein